MSKSKFVVLACVGLVAVILFFVAFSPTNRLIHAIQKGDINAVTRVLELGVDPNRTDIKPGFWGRFTENSPTRPICVACAKGNTEIVELLLAYGADPGSQENTGFSPLRTLLASNAPNKEEIAALLIQFGADPMEKDKEGMDFLFACADARVFVSGQYSPELAKAATNLLLCYIGDSPVDRKGPYGRTYLMYACQAGNLHMVSALLENGADPTVTDRFHQTIYDYASRASNSNEIITLLNG